MIATWDAWRMHAQTTQLDVAGRVHLGLAAAVRGIVGDAAAAEARAATESRTWRSAAAATMFDAGAAVGEGLRAASREEVEGP